MKGVTVVFIVSVIACIAIYDVIALVRGGGRATISSVVLAASYQPPYGALIPFLLGGLAVHLLTGRP